MRSLGSRLDGLLLDSDSVLDFLGHHDEGVLNVVGNFGGSLEESNAVVLGHLGTTLLADIAFVFQIALVAHQDSGDVVSSVLLNLRHPVMDVLVRLLVGDIVGNNDSVGTLVVGSSDGLEALLASGIPDLELDLLGVNLDGLDFEVDSDGRHEVVCEGVVSETDQEGGFTHTGTADEEHFEEVVAIKRSKLKRLTGKLTIQIAYLY